MIFEIYEEYGVIHKMQSPIAPDKNPAFMPKHDSTLHIAYYISIQKS